MVGTGQWSHWKWQWQAKTHSSKLKTWHPRWNLPSVLQHLDIKEAVTRMPWCAQAFVDIWYVLLLTANFLTFIVFCHKRNVFFSVDLWHERIYETFCVFPSCTPLLLGFLGLHTGQPKPCQCPVLRIPTALQNLRCPFQHQKRCIPQPGSALQVLCFPPRCSKTTLDHLPTGASFRCLSTWTCQMSSSWPPPCRWPISSS